MVLKPTQAGIDPVADTVLHQVAEFLDRIELRTVGWQRQQADVFRPAGIFGAQMETGLVLDNDMQGLGLPRGDLLQEKRMHVLVDAGG